MFKVGQTVRFIDHDDADMKGTRRNALYTVVAVDITISGEPMITIDDSFHRYTIWARRVARLEDTQPAGPHVSDLPQEATITPHACQDNRKTYDSGWSAYEYCSICDKKLKET